MNLEGFEQFSCVSTEEMLEDVRGTYSELRHVEKMLEALRGSGDRVEIMKYETQAKQSMEFIKLMALM